MSEEKPTPVAVFQAGEGLTVGGASVAASEEYLRGLEQRICSYQVEIPEYAAMWQRIADQTGHSLEKVARASARVQIDKAIGPHAGGKDAVVEAIGLVVMERLAKEGA